MNIGMVAKNLLYTHVFIVVFNLSGLPVAWGITDTEDINTYTEFFGAIKKRVPDAVISVLMTDDGKWLHLHKYIT